MSIATQVKRLQDVRNQIRAKMVSLGLSTNTDLLQDLANDLDEVAFRGDASTTLSTSTRSKTLGAGYYTGGTIKVPSDYFPVNSTNTTATAGDVLSGKKFVNTSGATVTGNIATATAGNVSGGVEGDNPAKITLTTEKTSNSSTTTATAKATIAKNLYTGSSNIVADLTSKKLTATAEATLATSVSGSKTIPGTLPPGTVTITPSTDNTKRIYSDSTNKGFVTNIVLNAMDTSSVSSATTTDPGTDYVNKATVTPSTSAQYIKITKGYLPNSKITVNKMADGSLSSATTANPGDSYANRVTVTPSGTDAQYIKISKGYLPDGKITISKMAAGSVASASTTNPGNSYTNQTTVTPSGTDAQYVKISAGYLPNSKITINKMASGSVSSASTTNPGDSYANQTTVTPSTSAQYVKVTAGYLPNSKITINKMADGSVSSATTTNPGDSYINKATVTPTTESDQYIKLTAGYLPNSKITVKAIPAYGFSIDTDAWSDMFPDETGSYTCTITGVTGVTADNDIAVYLSGSEVASCGVYAYAQGDSSITFRAFNTPITPIGCVAYILND